MTDARVPDRDDQTEVIAFLGTPGAYPGMTRHVECHETHGALVFLAGERAYKIKRAVKYDYMDFSTLDRRRQMVARELSINRQHAPGLYIGAIAITRQPDGSLAIGGSGTPVEHAVEMRRFSQADLLSRMAERNALTLELAIQLADTVLDSHRRMQTHFTLDADVRIESIISSVSAQLGEGEALIRPLRVEAFHASAMQQLHRARQCLRLRGESGLVRRCHGDLHLNNIVMLDGRPTPFDAIEFDDDLATIDTLYDLAFLLMDLRHMREHGLANSVLNRYLWRSAIPLDVRGLIAMPLFLGLRSGIRALTSAQRAMQLPAATDSADAADAQTYLAEALSYLEPSKPRLIAVGGYSGTGKSTLAAELAHLLAPAPGALHIRTDLERKSLFNVAETEHLAATCYTRAATERVYTQVFEKARLALAAGHSVVVDATFLAMIERAGLEFCCRGGRRSVRRALADGAA